MNVLLSVLGEWWRLLLTDSLYAAVVFVAAAIAARVLRHRPPRLHLLLWSAVVLRLVLPPGLDHPFSAGRLLDRVGLAIQPALEGTAETALAHPEWPGAAPDAARNRAALSMMTTPDGILGLVWLMGFALTASLIHRRRRDFLRLARKASPVTDPDLLASVEHWRRRLAVRTAVTLLQTEDRSTPFTFGLLRPRIVLPLAVAAKTELAEAVIAHELAHIARGDALWLLLHQIVQAVYFFNPVAWLVRARLEDARERACDELVLAQNVVPPRAYAAALLEVLRLDLQGVGAVSMASSKRRIAMRLTAILDHSSRSARAVSSAAALIIAGALFLLPLAGADDAAAPAAVGEVNASSDLVPDPGASSAQPLAVDLSNPLPGSRVTLGWGNARHPATGKVFHHDGIDLAAHSGTPVVAPADGTVAQAVVDFGNDPRGRWLTLQHAGGAVTYFGHLHQINVAVSQEVRRGDTIATVGSTGYSTGPHLHFEVRADGQTPTDPADSIDFN